MADLYFRILNPIVKTVLRSPLHGLLSKNTLLITFTGRKSGRQITTPVSYAQLAGKTMSTTSQASPWIKNLNEASDVTLLIKGKNHTRKPTLITDPAELAPLLNEFLTLVPRDAPHAGVKLDSKGIPLAADIEAAAKVLVAICFDPCI